MAAPHHRDIAGVPSRAPQRGGAAMTTPLPRISVVTSSFNQGQFIDAHDRSVMAQDYPNVEHIVVDGMSTDSTVDVLAAISASARDPRAGQRAGRRHQQGLPAGDRGDLLLPELRRHVRARRAAPRRPGNRSRARTTRRDGALPVHRRGRPLHRRRASERVREPPARARDLEGLHPAAAGDVLDARGVGALRSARRHGLLAGLRPVLSLQPRLRVPCIDQVLANYRLHAESKTVSASERERLESSIAVSRRYWGGLAIQDRLALAVSYMRFRVDRRKRARMLLSRAKASWRTSSSLPALYDATVGSMLAPDLDLGRRRHAASEAAALESGQPWPGASWNRRRTVHPQTLAWRGFESLHGDGWAGPTLVQTVEIDAQHTTLALVGSVAHTGFRLPLEIEASIDGGSLGRRTVAGGSQFVVKFSLTGVRAGSHQVRIVSSQHAVPHDIFGNQDYRPLSFSLEQLRLE